MNCPKCDLFTPDDHSQCVNCGHLLGKVIEPERVHKPAAKIRSNNFTLGVLAVLIIGIGILAALVLFKGGHTSMAANSDSPGQELDIKTLLEIGKINIFDFYSEYCPPCREIAPALKELNEKREDIVVIKIDINRENVNRIDFRSPVARQYRISFIPHFIIYDASGKRTHTGQQAAAQVSVYLQQEGIRY